jgi:UDP-glucose:(heptosyl)LPS alpha-1,3-glucosyltransferase
LSERTPLRIALVQLRHGRVGGAERYLDTLAVELAGRGHHVTIVCLKHGAAPHPAVRFARLRAIHVGNDWRMRAFDRAARRHVRRAKYDLVLGLGRTTCQDVIRFGGSCRETYYAKVIAPTLPAWQRMLGRGRLRTALSVALERRMFARGTYRRILVNSEMLRRELERRYDVGRVDVEVIHNGVDVERFHPRLRSGAGRALREELGYDDDARVVLFLGRGFARKGLDRLLEAFPGLLAEVSDARLLVVGDDDERARFDRAAARAGLGDVVTFLGQRNDPEACFAAADLHALPTRYDSFAYTVLESLATGVPVVTTRAAGAAEVVDDGVHGAVLGEECAPADLLAALVAWCDPARADAAAEACRARAETLTEARSAGRAADVLEAVAAGRGPV